MHVYGPVVDPRIRKHVPTRQTPRHGRYIFIRVSKLIIIPSRNTCHQMKAAGEGETGLGLISLCASVDIFMRKNQYSIPIFVFVSSCQILFSDVQAQGTPEVRQ